MLLQVEVPVGYGSVDIPSETLRPAAGAQEHVLETALAACAGMPSEDWALQRCYSTPLTRSALLRDAGCDDADYDLVLVLSGQATAFAYHPQRYEAVLITPDPDDSVRQRIGRATGLRLADVPHPGTAEGVWRSLIACMEERRPVRGEWVDDVVFCGYRAAEHVAARAVLAAGGWDRQRWWPWDMFEKWAVEFGRMERVAGPCAVSLQSEILREVVALLVRCADADPRGTVPELSYAQYGLQGLHAFVRDMSNPANRPDYWTSGWLGGHLAYRQVWGRGIASRYLYRYVEHAPPAIQPYLSRAADALAAAAVAWEGWGQWLGRESGARDSEDLRIVWMTATNRREGSDQAYLALRHEQEAARHLRTALSQWHHGVVGGS